MFYNITSPHKLICYKYKLFFKNISVTDRRLIPRRYGTTVSDRRFGICTNDVNVRLTSFGKSRIDNDHFTSGMSALGYGLPSIGHLPVFLPLFFGHYGTP